MSRIFGVIVSKHSGGSKLEEAIISALGKNVEKWERVDFEKKMCELKLDKFIPEEASASHTCLCYLYWPLLLFACSPAGLR